MQHTISSLSKTRISILLLFFLEICLSFVIFIFFHFHSFPSIASSIFNVKLFFSVLAHGFSYFFFYYFTLLGIHFKFCALLSRLTMQQNTMLKFFVYRMKEKQKKQKEKCVCFFSSRIK